jgi:hypothetical protein
MRSLRFLFVTVACLCSQWLLHGQYVTIQNGEFKLNGNRFFSLAVKYEIAFLYENVTLNNVTTQKYFASPPASYGPNRGAFESADSASAYNQILNDFTHISQLGFNTVVLIGSSLYRTGLVMYDASASASSSITVPNVAPYSIMFKGLQTVLNAAAMTGLKVIITTGDGSCSYPLYPDPNTPYPPWTSCDHVTFSSTYYEPYLMALGQRFKNNTTVLGYDLMVEPPKQGKGIVCGLVEKWHNAIRKFDPFHLLTIGVSQTTESIRGYDPGFLQIDFVSPHIYPHGLSGQNRIDQMKNDMAWCKDVFGAIGMPWMIGEIGYNSLIGDTTSWGNYTDQANFAKETLKASRDCGSLGYAWFQYGAGWDGGYGILDDSGNDKPVTLEFSPNSFDPNTFGNNCTKNNYFNYNLQTGNNVAGIILDQFNNPLPNAVILGYGQNWSGFNFTYSDINGGFILQTNFAVDVVDITAVGANRITLWNQASLAPSNLIGIVTLNKFIPPALTQNIALQNNMVTSPEFHEAVNITIQDEFVASSGDLTAKAFDAISITDFTAAINSEYHGFIGSLYPDCSVILQNFNRVHPQQDNTAQIALDDQSLQQLEELPLMTVYPNPGNNIIYISASEVMISESRITISDNVGRDLISESEKKQIDVSTLPPGMYSLTYTKDYVKRNFKLVIAR